VRKWDAIERVLWIVVLAYALIALTIQGKCLARLREQAVALLKRLPALGRRLTVGKMVEVVSLDFSKHQRAWKIAWLT